MKLPHWFSVRSQGKALGLPELIAIGVMRLRLSILTIGVLASALGCWRW